MNENLMMLCSVILVIGLFRCIIAGSVLEKHFSLVCGLFLLVLILRGVGEIELNPYFDAKNPPLAAGEYEALIKNRATAIIEENLCRALSERYDYFCDAKVTLSYTEDTYVVERVVIKGEEFGYIKNYLSDYLSLDERCIEFA